MRSNNKTVCSWTKLLIAIIIRLIKSKLIIFQLPLKCAKMAGKVVGVDRKTTQLPITKTCLYNFDPLKPHFYIVKLGFTGVYIFFLFLLKKIDCGYSLEPPRRGGSNEYPQSMFWAEIWKISDFFLSENVQFLEVNFSVYLNRRVFVMGQLAFQVTLYRTFICPRGILSGWWSPIKIYIELKQCKQMSCFIWSYTVCTCIWFGLRGGKDFNRDLKSFRRCWGRCVYNISNYKAIYEYLNPSLRFSFFCVVFDSKDNLSYFYFIPLKLVSNAMWRP